MKHLEGLKRGDPVIYHRFGLDMRCEFLEMTTFSGRNYALVWHEQDGKFLAPPSKVTITPKSERVM
ncbi:hypothetical protein [uncultured Pantoea sp.]|uniref:hypothetical protein n=1 Tax=uncultured Pantoea sp. TaxID=218084 RepID=UPI00204E40BE|nr:hypothetical protein [uncultured Pantoea sp.]DAL09289.1 MAG TPA_asm: hypothetical protein [Caudoviricetes sp.]